MSTRVELSGLALMGILWLGESRTMFSALRGLYRNSQLSECYWPFRSQQTLTLNASQLILRIAIRWISLIVRLLSHSSRANAEITSIKPSFY